MCVQLPLGDVVVCAVQTRREMNAVLQPSASSAKASCWRAPSANLALLSAVIATALAISCTCALSGLCSRHLRCPFCAPASADSQQSVNLTSINVPTGLSGPFECAPSIPCPIPEVTVASKRPIDDLDAWDLNAIPLAKRCQAALRLGQPGVCGVTESKRAFKESGVELDSLVSFEPCELFNLIQKRTLWIIGDSQQHALFSALLSFMSDFARTKRDVGRSGPIGIPSVDSVLTVGTVDKPKCMELMNETRICYVRIVTLYHKEFEYTMELLAHAIPMFRHHVVVFNVGVHYSSKMYQLSRDLDAVAKYRQVVRQAMGNDSLPLMLWIDTAPQHVSTPPGEYDSRKNVTSDMCSPFSDAQLTSTNRGTFNAISDDFVFNISDAHVRTWELAKRSYFSHSPRVGDSSYDDCTDYCRPGVPELWVYMLTKTLAGLDRVCR